jgi:hypothetical protein
LAPGAPAPQRAPPPEQRPISGVHSVRWEASGELSIEQRAASRLSIEAEPAVLAKIVTEVREGRLSIRFRTRPGRDARADPLRLELKTLAALDAHGAGTLRLGPLDVPTLSLRLGGSDDLRLTRLTAHFLDARLGRLGRRDRRCRSGRAAEDPAPRSGRFDAPGLASREATAVIEGSGEIRLAVAERLDAAIAGSGDVLFVGSRGSSRRHRAGESGACVRKRCRRRNLETGIRAAGRPRGIHLFDAGDTHGPSNATCDADA